MNSAKPNSIHIQSAAIDLTKSNSKLASLEEKAGVLGRYQAAWHLRGAAKVKVCEIGDARIQALGDVEKTAIALATATIKSAMVAEAMPALGTLTTQLNMATGAVDQSLTNGSMVEVYTHMTNRHENIHMVDSLRMDGKISVEEQVFLKDLATGHANNDINRTQDRLQMAKDTVEAIHKYGVDHIQKAKDNL